MGTEVGAAVGGGSLIVGGDVVDVTSTVVPAPVVGTLDVCAGSVVAESAGWVRPFVNTRTTPTTMATTTSAAPTHMATRRCCSPWPSPLGGSGTPLGCAAPPGGWVHHPPLAF